MVEHFGHLDQMPSGISRFLDLEVPIFGFLMKVVPELLGEVAGSRVSSPSDFFVNEVVAINLLIVHCTIEAFRGQWSKHGRCRPRERSVLQRTRWWWLQLLKHRRPGGCG